MVRQRRLTRKEKIAQSSAIKAGVISDPRHLINLPEGTYTVTGAAATVAHQQALAGCSLKFDDDDACREN